MKIQQQKFSNAPALICKILFKICDQLFQNLICSVMNRWKKPVLVNLIVVAALVLCNILMVPHRDKGDLYQVYLPRFFASGIIILLLTLINLVIGMVRNRDRKRDGPIYLIISGIVLLIGFSVCTL